MVTERELGSGGSGVYCHLLHLWITEYVYIHISLLIELL